MGAGIAAASAAAGCRVLMLDISTEAVERGLAIVEEGDRHLVETGTFDADLAKIADYDWICEAIVEDLDTKRGLFEKVEPLRKDGSVISSNTSGIPLSDISADMPERLRADIAITHFFNPVKVMRLFELCLAKTPATKWLLRSPISAPPSSAKASSTQRTPSTSSATALAASSCCLGCTSPNRSS